MSYLAYFKKPSVLGLGLTFLTLSNLAWADGLLPQATNQFTIASPPTLRAEVINNEYVRLDWATEILPENMIYQTGFEAGDDINPTAYLGGMSISKNNCYQGTSCLLMANGKSNGNNGHYDGTTSNRYDFNPVYGLDVGMRFSASMWIKNIGESDAMNLVVAARGGVPRTSTPFHTRYGFTTPFIVAEDTSTTPEMIKIQNFDEFYNSLESGRIYSLSSAISTNYEGEWIPFTKDNLSVSERALYVGTTVTPNYKKGDMLHNTDYVYPLVLNGPSTPPNGEWTLYNFNGAILDYDYDTALRGLIPYLNTDNEGGMYIDDIRFGHATKVKLYRNNQVIYEGYDAKLDDYSATDQANPNMVDADSVIASFSNNQVNINFNQATDNGSSYTYYVEPLDKNNNAGLPSDKKTEVITSGIVGYSFVIDQNKTTSPDAIIDTTSTTIQQSLVGNKDYYLHIRTIDKNGNVSDTAHIKLEGLKLTAEAKPSENMIRLDWTDLTDHSYQVFQKKEGSNDFQSISMTDLSSSKQVQVLNVYPHSNFHTGYTPSLSEQVSYQTWDGESVTLPLSASLKQWMEEPNAEHPKGYGQGLIEVTALSIEDFNDNPNGHLKNADGTYRYDVIMFGSRDGYWGWDLNQNSLNATLAFINAQHGVLVGHDALSQPFFNQLAPVLNVKTRTQDPNIGYAVGDDQIAKLRNGLLSNYPWNLTGTIFNIPRTHTSYQAAQLDNIWFNFVKWNDGLTVGDVYEENLKEVPYEANGFSNNFYLATWNNTAVIQTGHMIGRNGIDNTFGATPDEQKILANTLFYLNQLSDTNYLNDHSGQDVKAPNKPVSKSTKTLSDGYVEITLDTLTDQGSTYEYYVKASHKNGNSSVVSNIETETITSGIAGISYIIDTNPDTEPDNQLDSFINNKIKVKPNSNQTTYLHIKTIDHAGNVSETEHIMISISKINTAEQQEDNIYLNWDIGIPQNSILFQTDFESTLLDYSQQPDLEINATTSSVGKHIDPYGNIWPLTHPIRNSIKILPNLGLNQTSGVRVNKTTDKLGWDYHWYPTLPSPNGESDTSSVDYGDWIQLVGDSDLIARFDVKGNGTITTKINPGFWTGGSIEDPRFTWAEDLTASEFWHRLNQNIPIKINNKTGESEQNYHLATALDRNLSYNYLLAQGDIYKENGQWYYKCTIYAYAWKDWVRPEQSVTPDDQRTISDIKTGQPLYVLESQEDSSSNVSVDSTNWTSYSLNLTVPNTEIVEALNYYFLVTQTFETPDFIQLDNLTVAYTPKSRLYRDGKLILEDYTVEHVDQDVKDTTAPEKAVVSVDYVDGKLQLTWQEVKDKGTIYTYEVSGVNENGQESLRSEPKEVEFISGIKEYKIYLNGTLVETTTNPNYQFEDEITSSDRIEIGVVDHAGNESKTNVLFLNLTAEAKPNQNMIRLDWNALTEHTYQAYQKKEGSNEFQSISMTDLGNQSKINVLNLYPQTEPIYGTISFSTWDGESLTLPPSASLKKWMEEPNAEHPKGYGQGLLEVTPVEISKFNQKPLTYLKNSDSTWKYDVIMVGSWDLNNNIFPNSSALTLLKEFIEDGNGFLIAHDTIGGHLELTDGLNSLRDYANIKVGYWTDSSAIRDKDHQYQSYFLSTRTRINKKGLLTNYPWIIGEIGTTLTIPETHTTSQFAYGDIWLNFYDTDIGLDRFPPEHLKDVANFYLTTYNNVAMVQTGHSQGQATTDEQKILANTLFYLNQLSDANYLNDHSGQDVKAPEKPTTQSTKALSDGYVEITFDTLTDQGSTYEYYVKASHKNGSSSVVSNIETETITSGIAGVSYIIDTNPDTEPDNQLDSFSNNKIKVKPNSDQATYLHIKTVDNAGNVSKTEHIMISIPKINTAEQRDETIYLNWDIEIPTSSVFWVEDFSSKYLDLPNNILSGIAFNANGHEVDHWGVSRPLNDVVRNGVKIIDGVGYNGGRGVVVNQTAPGNGWTYQVYAGSALPVSSVDWSGTRFTDWQKLKTDRPAIARFLTKGEGEFRINLAADWTGNGVNNVYGYTWAENLTAAEFRTRLENLQPIKVNNPSGTQSGGFHLTTAFDYNYSYNFHLSIGNIVLTNGQWYYHPTAWYGPWVDSVKPGQTVTPAADRKVEPITIGKPLAQLQGTPAADNTIKISTNDWTNYSMNLYLPTSQEIADLGDYFRLMTFFKSYSQMHIDEIQIAYAPKSRLYRDGKLILEDFTVEHTDQDVKDTTAPEKALVSVDYVDGKLQLTWQEVKDKGTIYTYEVSGVNENGQESLRSEPKEVEFISGIKEYRVYLNGTLVETTTNPNYQFNDELTPSDRVEIGVVDEAGNESKTEIEFLNLTTEAKPSENMIRLDWDNVFDSFYQVFQRKENASDFISIGRSLEPVKVLNVYPTNWEYSTFTTWDGETLTLPVGGMLKKWMEEPNAEHPKGYGRGLIEVTPVDYASFNQNPAAYLKQNPDGTWNYDVVMVGSYDCNGDCNSTTNNYFSTAANTVVSDFIDNGYGVLIGHDFRSLANKVETEGIPAVEPVGSSLVKISKKGILTNFPWNLGDIGTILQIPYTHNAGPYVEDSNIWMKFEGNNDPNHCYYGHYNWCRPDKFWSSSTNNHYLAIKNNIAMIQTGHVGGSSTPDEQKIIANTLFFLKQISDQNHLNDYSGQDVKGPNKPVSKSTKALSDGYVEITFDTLTDQGSTYEYYVKASHKNGNSSVVSNIETETITSGIAGVSYIIDTNPDTEPDNQLDSFSNNKIKVNPNSDQTTYLHIKTIDNAGNVSETEHIMISIPKINIAEQRDETIYLNWDIEVPTSSIIWNDDFSLKHLDLPNNILSGITVPYNGINYDLYGNKRPADDIVRRSLRIIDGVGISGTRGVVATQTLPNNGWNYTYYGYESLPMPGVDISGYRDSNWQQLITNRPAIVRFATKGNGEFGISISPEWTGNGVDEPNGVTWATNLTAQEFLSALINKTPIKVNNPTNQAIFNIHLTTAFDYTNSYNFKLSVGRVTKNNNDGNWYYTSEAWHDSWSDAVKPGQYVTPVNQRAVEPITVGKRLSVLQGSPSGYNQIAFDTNDWTNYSMDIYIPNSPEVVATGSYFRMTTVFKTASQFYLDNLVFAYAPQSRLYRDGKLILEDFTVQHIDQDVKDTTAPEKALVSVDYVDGKLQLTWQEVKDKGTIYTYEVSGVNENGQESLRSEPKDVEFISGIKEYRIYLNGTLIDTTTNPNYQFNDELTPSDRIEIGVVDEAGNESKTEVEFFNLTAEAKPSENMIRLDWNNLTDHMYQAYQKREDSEEFQSISMMDLDTVDEVNVLNLYPYIESTKKITFTTWDGETHTLHESASLKKWMEEPTPEYPKGYGLGIIKVDPVALVDFQANINAYDVSKYDVIFIGASDANGTFIFSDETINFLLEWVGSGKGLVMGHDSLNHHSNVENNLNIKSIVELLNMQRFIDLNYTGTNALGSKHISVVKTGLLTNYPHLIDTGNLTIPLSHSWQSFAYGDVWIKFTNLETGNNGWSRTESTDPYGRGTNNFYLTTWNNVAMIQTGHVIDYAYSGTQSDVRATPDEQKILANTLFYLNQLSAVNYLDDYSGQDVKAPSVPVVQSSKALNNGYIELTFKPFEDQGSTYDYYVKATHKNGSSGGVSNIATETITSGIAGVSYIIDTNPDTIPDEQLDTLTNNQIQIKPTENGTIYLHIKTIDKVGNISETQHIPITTPPVLRSEVIDNEYVRLDWATEILPENVLWEIDFESNEQSLINLIYDSGYSIKTGGQAFKTDAYKGSYSLYTPNTYPDKGNEVLYPYNYTSWKNALRYTGKKIALPNGTPISAAFRIKSSGYTELSIYSDWRYGNEFLYPYTSTYVQDYPVGTKVLKVSNISEFVLNNKVSADSSASVHKHNAHIHAIDTVNSTITLDTPIAEPIKAGDRVKHRPQVSMFGFDQLNINGTGDWELYNLNTTTTNPYSINWLNNPVILRQTWWADADTYLDNLVVGHATKVRLYRDGMQIYEGYDAYLNDLEAKDKSKPNTIDLSSLTITSERQDNGLINWNLTFNPASDTGSTYSYQISSVNKFGLESIKSDPVTETVTSGVKGYSYVIDSYPTTEPDNTIDLQASKTSINYKGTNNHYLHIKTIDNAGNISETVHVPLKNINLRAEAKPTQNMIRLDWTKNQNSTFQVFQKKEGDTEFQSISTTDFSDTKQIKVLNIYPTLYGVFNSYDVFQIPLDSTFTTWDGETLTLPQSAKLKRWMEEPNSEHPKGYGKGLIEVTPIGIEIFNQNPLSYLKNLDGTWKYDVVMIGTWDANGNNADITESGRDLLIEFLEDNRGVLFGHDTIRGLDSGFDLSPYLNSLHPYVNLTLNNIDFSELRWHRSTNVEVSKKGLLNSYPWDIGNIGTTLTIPESHTVDQLPGGDIWFKFKGKTSYDEYNYYLTTWNNTAMIQTGHSNGAATPDEQKILANTLFYLNQLSSNNWLDDYSGQDVKAPEKPSVFSADVLSTGEVKVVFNDSIDYGSIYEYYVKAIHKSGSEQVSNTVSEMIMTGVKGVSYVIDTNPTTEPDSHIEPLTNQTILVKPNQTKTTYLHIKTIDNAGNESETLHFELDILTLTAEAKPTENDGKGLVRLDWTAKPEHIYQVYQKKENETEFQSISMTDLSKTDQVIVLNVYPDNRHIPDLGNWATTSDLTTFTTWDSETLTLPTSGALKQWMEEPNDEHPKGYGHGIIEVIPVTMDNFNSNPDLYLKNIDGTYKIDVIMFGSWDSYGYQDLTTTSLPAVKAFLETGRGVLLGHDASYRDVLNQLHDEFGFTTNRQDSSIYGIVGDTQVSKIKTGLLTNYPWNLANKTFTIPRSHNSKTLVNKNSIWLEFVNVTDGLTTNESTNSLYPETLEETSTHSNNFYLSTFNNTAIIQTGHSRGQATPDEQKILANTLFYLNQLSDVNYLNDYSGQDLKAPDKPSIKNHTYTNDRFISLTFDAVKDNGSLYEYYVKATHKDGNGAAFSNIASATVTTGVKGYSWIADNNADTIPDDIIEQSNNSNIKIPTNNRGPYYLHIKAIDQAGNVSETLHYELTDIDAPTLTLTQNPTDWTNQDVIITATATDNGKFPSGIKEIILPDGNRVAGSTATFTAIQNGTYTFEAVDFMGNRQTASITISNIDKIKPTGSIIIDQNQDEFYEEDTEIHINMSDILDGQERLSGIAKVEIFDVNGTYSHTMTNPTDYQQTLPWVLVPYELSDGSLKAQIGMILTDKAGNTTTVYSKEVTIIKVRVEEFHLTDVVNPSVYNKNNPFTRLTYPNIPSQELLSGGSFEFEAVYSYPPTANTSWTADYEAIIHYIRPDGGRSTETIELTLQPVDGIFTARHSIPFSISTGTEVYLELSVKAYNGTRKLMGQDSFPDPQGTLLKIGEVTGDIRSLIQFNEIY